MRTSWELEMGAVDRRAFLWAGVAAVTGMPQLARAASDRKVLVGAIEEDPSFINPGLTTSVSSFAASCPVYSALTHIPHEGQFNPELAEKWEISADGKTYVFHLRQDVLWHDGQPFTSADVKFTIENITSKLHPWGRVAYKALERVETPDSFTVIYHLKQPSAVLMYATDFAVGSILPKHLWEGTEYLKNPLNFKPVGTGPYKLVEYGRGREIRYEKNDKFYLKDAPQFDEVILRVIPDATTRLASFEQGELDMLYWSALPQAETPRLSSAANVQMTKSTLRGVSYMGVVNTRKEEFHDPAVRRAIYHAIDRKFIRQSVDGGTTSSEVIGTLWPSSPLYNKQLVDYDFDPAKANDLLDKAGLKRKADGTRFSFDLLWVAYDIAGGKIADILARNLAAIGLTANLQPLDRAALNQRAYVSNNFGIVVEVLLLGPDPDIGVERMYNSHNIINAPYSNNSGYTNPLVDQLFDEQRVQVDTAKRKVIYDQIQQILWNDLPVMPFFAYEPNNVFHKSSVSGIYGETNGAYESYLHARPVGGAAGAASDAATGSAGMSTASKAAAGAVAVVAIGAAAARWRMSRKQKSDEV